MAAAEDPSARAMFERADHIFRQGGTGEALSILRELRSRYPGSPEAADSLALSIEISLARDDVLRARYFLSALMAFEPDSKTVSPFALKIADSCYKSDSYSTALEYYRIAVETSAKGTGLTDIDRALLRTAELTLYTGRDATAARYYFMRVRGERLGAQDAILYKALSHRLRWETLSAESLGLSDENVSFIHADGDDVWVGTWNGGLSRYSVASGDRLPFSTPATTVRSIEILARRVWVGTSEGLFWFSKVSSRWGPPENLGLAEPPNVQALAEAGGELYAGTLGDGLFRLRSGTWMRVEDGGLPGPFITCLAPDRTGTKLLVGTMTLGLIILDLQSGAMRRLSEEHPEIAASNITSVLHDSLGRIWIGTYGEGLFLWTGGKDTIRSFTRSSGEIGDDWILSACETPAGIYFGSFGGGVSVLSKGAGTWRRLGISDGLASLDITAIAYRAPYVFFGTLGAGVARFTEGQDGGGDGTEF